MMKRFRRLWNFEDTDKSLLLDISLEEREKLSEELGFIMNNLKDAPVNASDYSLLYDTNLINQGAIEEVRCWETGEIPFTYIKAYVRNIELLSTFKTEDLEYDLDFLETYIPETLLHTNAIKAELEKREMALIVDGIDVPEGHNLSLSCLERHLYYTIKTMPEHTDLAMFQVLATSYISLKECKYYGQFVNNMLNIITIKKIFEEKGVDVRYHEYDERFFNYENLEYIRQTGDILIFSNAEKRCVSYMIGSIIASLYCMDEEEFFALGEEIKNIPNYLAMNEDDILQEVRELSEMAGKIHEFFEENEDARLDIPFNRTSEEKGELYFEGVAKAALIYVSEERLDNIAKWSKYYPEYFGFVAEWVEDIRWSPDRLALHNSMTSLKELVDDLLDKKDFERLEAVSEAMKLKEKNVY